jgi:hypothetical protein
VTGDRASPESRSGWRAWLPVSLLVVVACAQVTLATTAGLTPWKGGGFGMFSTTDDGGRRYVRVFVSGVGRSEEIAISPSLEDAARRAAVLPRDAQLSRLARRIVERERRHRRPVDMVRIETWRIEYAQRTLEATTRLTREFVYRVDSIPAPRR